MAQTFPCIKRGAIVGFSSAYFPLADDERTLHALARPLIALPDGHWEWYAAFEQYGLLQDHRTDFDHTANFDHLMAVDDRSPSSRYARLLDDFNDDFDGLPEFFETATRMSEMDDRRRNSLAFVSSLSSSERATYSSTSAPTSSSCRRCANAYGGVYQAIASRSIG